MAEPLCPEAEFRASLNDGEFWDYVLNGRHPDDPVDDYDPTDDEARLATPCPRGGAVVSLTLPDDLRAITVYGEYAALVAAGLKTIETRSRPTSYRGLVGIHAAKRRPKVGQRVGPWLVDWGAHPDLGGFTNGGFDEGLGYVVWKGSGPLDDAYMPVHLGAIVAVANVVDCAPIVGPLDEDEPTPHAVVVGQFSPGDLALFHEGDPFAIGIDDQLPYGDFTPGRYALLLEDVTRLPDPVPAKGNQAVPWRVPADVAAKVREQVEGLAA